MSKNKSAVKEQETASSESEAVGTVDASEALPVSNGNAEQPTSLKVNPSLSTRVSSDEEYAAFMDQINKANEENIGLGEIQISRISVMQGITKEIGQRVAGYEPGQFFDNMSREVISTFGKAPWMLDKVPDPNRIPSVHYLALIPIMRLPSEYVKWPSKDERTQGVKNFHWKDLDVHAPRVREGLWKPKGTWVSKEKGQPPPVTEHLNILCFCLNDDGTKKTGLMINSYSKTSYRTGQRLVSSCVQQRASQLPFWGRVKYIYSEAFTDAGNTWSVVRFANGPKLLEFGDPDNQELMKQTFRECFEEARHLSDQNPSEFDSTKTKGRYLQELYINAAQFDVDTEVGDPEFSGDGSDGGVNDADTANPTF